MILKFLNLIRLASRNSRYYFRYTVGAIAVAAMSFLALTAFRCYMVDVKRAMAATWSQRFMYGDVLVEGKDGGPIDPEAQALLTAYLTGAKPPVQLVARFLTGEGSISNGLGATIFLAKAYDVKAGADLRGSFRRDTIAGKPLYESDSLDEVVLGQGLAKSLGCDVDAMTTASPRSFKCPARPVTLKATAARGFVNEADVGVVGVVDGFFRDIDARLVMLPLPALQQLLGTKSVTYFAVKLEDAEEADALIEDFSTNEALRGVGLTALRWQNHKDADLYRRCLDYMDIVSFYTSAIMLIVASASVFSAFLKLAGERTKEIGTLRAIGYRDRLVVATFAVEGLFAALAAAVFGGLLTLAASAILNRLAIPYSVLGLTEKIPFTLAYDPKAYAATGAYLILISVTSAAFAMVATTRRPIVLNLAGPAA